MNRICKCLLIATVMFLIGFGISSKISDYHIDKNEEYNKAVKITSTEMFQYGMNTNVGNAFIYGELEAVDPVTYPEIEGEYLYIKKVEEHYNKHTRTVTKTRTNSDGKTETYTEVEIYYSWDYFNSWQNHSSKIRFCKIEFDYGKITIPNSRYIFTEHSLFSDIRYVYFGCDRNYSGTIYTKLQNNTISDNTAFYNDMNIEKTVLFLETEIGLILFWILWIGLVIGAVYAYCRFEKDNIRRS